MKFKEYVEGLVKYLEEHPETAEYTAITAIDDEGNGYNEIYVDEPTVGIYDGEYSGEFISHEDDLQEREEEGEDVTLNAICLN